jgi:hypothetical protein
MRIVDFLREKLKNPYEKINSTENISDQRELAKIARKASNAYVRWEAIAKLEDKSVLMDISKHYSNYGDRDIAEERLVEVASKTDDQSILADMAQRGFLIRVRQSAIEKLENKQILVDIAKHDSSLDVRVAAVEKLEDQSLWADIANDCLRVVHNSSEAKEKYAAIDIILKYMEKANDTDLVARIESLVLISKLRKNILSKKVVQVIDDILPHVIENSSDYKYANTIEFLSEIAVDGSTPQIREAATKKLVQYIAENEIDYNSIGIPISIYSNYAKNGANAPIKAAGTNKMIELINSPELRSNILNELVKEGVNEQIRDAAATKILEISNDDENISTKLMIAESEGISQEVQRTVTEHVVRYVNTTSYIPYLRWCAKLEKNEEIRKQATAKLIYIIQNSEDPNLIGELGPEEINPEVTRALTEKTITGVNVKKITDRATLEAIVNSDAKYEIKDEAKEKLGAMQKAIRKIRENLKIGMSIKEVEKIFGDITAQISGEDVLDMVDNLGSTIDGSASGIQSMMGKEYMQWDRPEGTYRLVFQGGRLEKFYSFPPDIEI